MHVFSPFCRSEQDQHEDHEDDVFKESLPVRHYDRIPKASAIRYRVGQGQDKREYSKEKHENKQYPVGTPLLIAQDQYHAKHEFESGKQDPQGKGQRLKPFDTKRMEIV